MVVMRWISLGILLLIVSTAGAQESYYRGKTVTFSSARLPAAVSIP